MSWQELVKDSLVSKAVAVGGATIAAVYGKGEIKAKVTSECPKKGERGVRMGSLCRGEELFH